MSDPYSNYFSDFLGDPILNVLVKQSLILKYMYKRHTFVNIGYICILYKMVTRDKNSQRFWPCKRGEGY